MFAICIGKPHIQFGDVIGIRADLENNLIAGTVSDKRPLCTETGEHRLAAKSSAGGDTGDFP